MVHFPTGPLRLAVSLRSHRRLLAPVVALWAVELLPVRFAATPWIELSLALIAILEGGVVFRGAFGPLWGAPAEARDLAVAAACLWGTCLSFLLATLHAAGSLPLCLLDARGGSLSFAAVSATVLALRAVAVGRHAPAGRQGETPRRGADPLSVLIFAFPLFALSISLAAFASSPAVAGSPPWFMAASIALFAGAAPDALSVIDRLRDAGRKSLLTGVDAGAEPRAVEDVSMVDWILLERSGVITVNRPKVTHVEPFGQDARSEDVLHLAALAEYAVKHPIRDAIIERYGTHQRTVAKLPSSVFLPGRGVRAIHLGKELLVGNLRLLGDAGWPASKLDELSGRSSERATRGETVIFVTLGGDPLGMICLADALRSDAAEALARLVESGVRTAVFSGDLPRPLEAMCGSFPDVEVHAAMGAPERDRLIESRRSAGRRPALVRRPRPGEPHHGEQGFLLEWRTEGKASDVPPGEQKAQEPSHQSALAFIPGERLVAIADFLAAAKALQGIRRKGASIVLAHHALLLPVLCGALEPWTGIPPMPVLAAIAGTTLPAMIRVGVRTPRPS